LEKNIAKLENELNDAMAQNAQLSSEANELDEAKQMSLIAAREITVANEIVSELKEQNQELSERLLKTESHSNSLEKSLNEVKELLAEKITQCLDFKNSVEGLADELNSRKLDIASLELRNQSYLENDQILNSKIEELENCKASQTNLISSLQRGIQVADSAKAATLVKGI
jgi:chromosome segregation ATPase